MLAPFYLCQMRLGVWGQFSYHPSPFWRVFSSVFASPLEPEKLPAWLPAWGGSALPAWSFHHFLHSLKVHRKGHLVGWSLLGQTQLTWYVFLHLLQNTHLDRSILSVYTTPSAICCSSSPNWSLASIAQMKHFQPNCCTIWTWLYASKSKVKSILKKKEQAGNLDLPQAGNFVYTGTSGLFQGVQRQGYRVRMFIHRATIYNHNLVQESLPFNSPPHGTFNYPLQRTQAFKAGNQIQHGTEPLLSLILSYHFISL